MDIGSVMAALRGYEAALKITSPYALSIKRAYLYIPDKQTEVPDADPACFFNGYTLLRSQYLPNQQRERDFAIDIQLLVKDPSLDTASQIASAFEEQLELALQAHQTLGGACTEHALRGKSSTLTRLEWAGLAYVGLNLILDVHMRDSVATVGP